MKIQMNHGNLIVNGKVHENMVGTVDITDGKILFNGKPIEEYKKQQSLKIIINGNVDSISTEHADVVVNGNVRELTSNRGNITCNDVMGNINCNRGDVSCGNVKGNVTSTYGNITHR